MSEAPVITEGRKASSLGERLYEVAKGAHLPSASASTAFHERAPWVQASYERAAISFVARLTYAESEGVREALLSSVLVEAMRPLVERLDRWDAAHPQRGPYPTRDSYRVDVSIGDLRRLRAAIAQAEGRADG